MKNECDVFDLEQCGGHESTSISLSVSLFCNNLSHLTL